MALCPTNMAAGLIVLAMGLGGCVSKNPGDHKPALALAPQSSDAFQCGPTTLASVFAYHGVPVPEEEISKIIYSPGARGVLLMDLARVARSHGFTTVSGNGSLDDLRMLVASGKPPIVLLDLGAVGIRKPHFSAVTGVTDEGVFLLGTQTANDYISHPLFARQWKLAGNQFLVLSPPSP
jgi:ABC-type bacteriocin/lantibiotic exporter with double-glycine peptidase domain